MAEKGPAGETKGTGAMHRQWEHGQAAWEESRDEIWLCREGVRKAKLELNLARDTRNNRKGFFRSGNQERKVKEGVTP